MSRHMQARQQVVDACLRLADRGYLAGTGGNVSLRIDERLFAMTPSGVDYYSMTAGDVCILRLDTLAVEEGGRKPSVERGLHAALLRARPDAASGVHTHQPLASAVALLGVELPVEQGQERLSLGPRVAAVAYAPSGTWLLVRALRRRLRYEVNAYLLRNHGLLCCGPTMAAAIGNAELVERAAARFLRAAMERAGAGELARETLSALP